MTLRGIAFVLGLLLLSGRASAECISSDQLPAEVLPAAGASTAIAASGQPRGRMVAPVLVNGVGPFRFIVDTGANRSALSPTVVDRLGLAQTGEGEVHSVHGVTSAPFVRVGSLHFGDIALAGNELPMLQGPMLGGEHGLLGADGLQGRRLRMDFESRCIEIGPSQPTRRRTGWTLVQGELRFGHLVVIEGRIRDAPVSIFLDTGSDSTLSNVALRERLRSSVRIDTRRSANARSYTAGDPVVLDNVIQIPRLSIGDVDARNITAYVGDFHIFRLWDLLDQPALLIGMDVLSQTRALIIDYEEGTVQFRLRTPPRTGSRLRDTTSNSGIRIIR
jgi:predicted aspartyl protease